jgi:hypothetical protein
VELHLHFPILCHGGHSEKFIFISVLYLDHIQYVLTSRCFIQCTPPCRHLTLYHVTSLAPFPNAVYLPCCYHPHTLRLVKPLQTVHYTMLVDVYIHTRHTPLRSFINWELVSTPSIGHHQAIMQDNECLQKLNTRRQEITPFHIKKH